MKTLLLSFTLVILLHWEVVAQHSVSISAGANHCYFHQKIFNDDPGMIFHLGRPTIGFSAGIKYSFRFSEYLGLTTTLDFSQKGFRYYSTDAKESYNYLSFTPLIEVFPFGSHTSNAISRMSFSSGFGYAYKINNNVPDNDIQQSIFLQLNLNYSIGRFLLAPVFELDILPFYKTSFGNSGSENYSYYFRSIGMAVNYKLFENKP